jgi:hypothetical protein
MNSPPSHRMPSPNGSTRVVDPSQNLIFRIERSQIPRVLKFVKIRIKVVKKRYGIGLPNMRRIADIKEDGRKKRGRREGEERVGGKSEGDEGKIERRTKSYTCH